MYTDNLIGFGLSVGSSAFIGSSFIIKKKGLQRAGASGSRATSAVAVVLVLVLYCEPLYGQKNIMVYIGVCSIIGSLTVMSVIAVGISIRLTIEGSSQVARFQTWVFVMVAASCIITQLNYLNKALDTFNTAVVSPIHYAMFTSLTIFASATMFKVGLVRVLAALCRFSVDLLLYFQDNGFAQYKRSRKDSSCRLLSTTSNIMAGPCKW